MTERNERLAWSIAVAVFLCLALWPLWVARFPPMQDYPQHLAHAQMLREQNNPAFDYNRYYEFRLRPVYATFFLTTLFFAKFVPIEIAGKLSLSLYPVLIAAVVWKLGRRFGKDAPPWGALLFFPLAFNQLYFQGNVNYILSLPILVLALLDFEELMKNEMGLWPVLRQSVWQILLFITHPLNFLVYVSMAIVGAMLTQRQAKKFWMKLTAAMGVAFLLLIAAWIENRAMPTLQDSATRIIWISPKLTMEFFALMFNGMQWSSGPDSAAAILWGATAVVILGTLLLDWRKRDSSSLTVRHLLFLIMATIGMFVLPLRIGEFSYINVRLAVIIYFLLALLATQVRLKRWAAFCLIVLLGLCMIHSLVKQARLSAEVKEILPIISKIPPNSRILPLVFDNGSPELWRPCFDFHLHDHNYYHVLVGGGFNPYMLKAPLHPVRYKSGAKRPAPGEYQPGEFNWAIHSADYQYFLVRGAPKGFGEYMAPTCDELLVSGMWTLFARKTDATDSNGNEDQIDSAASAFR